MTSEYNEIWKQIDGYGNYYVSNFGRVKNIETERILKPYLGNRGYFTNALSKNCKVAYLNTHRIVAFAFIEKPEGKYFVDHIDGNKTNNNASNLRWVSNAENSRNTKKQKNTSSTFKGVSYFKTREKWRAHITFNAKFIHLGYFDDEKDAAKAYNKKAIELFGEYAKLNDV